MRCFPLILPNHASSEGSADGSMVSASSRDCGTVLNPSAAAAAAMRLRKRRRGVGARVRSSISESSLVDCVAELVGKAITALHQDFNRVGKMFFGDVMISTL